jgi:DNA-binding phage protein
MEIRQTDRFAAVGTASMIVTETHPWDVVESLDSESAIAAYLEAALEDGDPGLIAAALSDIARVKGLTPLAQELEPDNARPHPPVHDILELATVLKTLRVLGLSLQVRSL